MTTRLENPTPDDDRIPLGQAHGGRASRWVMLAIGVVVVGGAVWGLRARSKQAAGVQAAASAAIADRVVPVADAVVEQKDVQIWLEGLGSATPLATVTVKTQVDGRLDRVFFKEGQSVKAGEVIAQIDPRPFTIALHQAEAAFARDNAQFRNAKLNLERYKTLRAQNLIPQQQVDDQQTVADQAAGLTQADQTQIESAKLQLDYAQIKSPIAGVTGVRLVDPGNVVHQADPGGIVVITQLDPMAVLFTLPEDDLPRVQKEMAKGAIPLEAWSRDGAIKLGTGQLALIDNEVNQATATIRLKAILPNPDRVLWPNEFVKARLLLSTRKGAITVPAPAILRGPQGTFVYVIGADQTVQPRPVDVDTTQGDVAILSKGLQVGEHVVTDGQNQLRAGAKVAPRGDGAPKTKPLASAPPKPPPANGSSP